MVPAFSPSPPPLKTRGKAPGSGPGFTFCGLLLFHLPGQFNPLHLFPTPTHPSMYQYTTRKRYLTLAGFSDFLDWSLPYSERI